MAIFNWNSNFDTGIEKIDAQHKYLVHLINQLDTAVAIGSEPQFLLNILNELVDYSHYHFDAEESFMRELHYPEELFCRHQQEHQNFIESVQQVKIQRSNNADCMVKLLGFLITWLSDHILNSDKGMVSALAGANQSASSESSSEILYRALCESETRFRDLADSLPAFIWISNANKQRIYHNKHWLKTCKSEASQCDHGEWLNCIHPDDRDRLLNEYSKAFTEHNNLQIEYRIINHEGNYLWILESAIPRLLNNKEFSGFMGWGIDITRQKQTEAALALSVEQLEKTVYERTQALQLSNEILQQEKAEQTVLIEKLKETQSHLMQSEKMASIGQLAAGVAHEINNPLGYIYSNLNTLQHYLQDIMQFIALADRLAGQLPAENTEAQAFQGLKKELELDFLTNDLHDLIRESMEGATRARKIVQDLRDFSRLDKQDKDLFNIEEGIDATLNIVHNELKYKAEILKEYGGLKPIYCVGSQLNQVFMNLLVNAAHAIEDYGKITIRTGYKDDKWLWIEIEDTGKGMSEEIKNKIFNPFFTTKPVGKGTGLGLSLSYKIIQDHQGEFIVESILGQGSKFKVCLPITSATG